MTASHYSLSLEPLESRLLLSASPLQLSYSDGWLSLPGTPEDVVTVSANWTQKQADFNNEVLLFDGERVSGIDPAATDFAIQTLGASTEGITTLFNSGAGVGAETTFVLPGGTNLGLAMVQDSTLQSWLENNPSNDIDGGRLAFFSLKDANPDDFDHLRTKALSRGRLEISWEDITFGGDQDFTDVVFTVELLSIEPAEPDRLRFGLVTGSPGVEVDSESGQINWKQLGEGTCNFTVTVSSEASEIDNPPPVYKPTPPADVPGLTESSQVFLDDFESGGTAEFWTECAFCGSHSLITDDGTGNHAFKTTYSFDLQAAQLSVYPLDDIESVYVSFNQQFPTGFNERALKSARVFQASGDKEATFGLQFWPLEGVRKLVTHQQATLDGGDYTPFDYGENEWVRVSFLIRQNDPGFENGVLQVWRNDELVLDRHDVLFRHCITRSFWESFD